MSDHILRPEADIIARVRETEPSTEIPTETHWDVPPPHTLGENRPLLLAREEMLCVHLFEDKYPACCMMGLFKHALGPADKVLVLGNPSGEVAQFLWRMGVLDSVPVVYSEIDELNPTQMHSHPRFLASDPVVPRSYFVNQLNLWLNPFVALRMSSFDLVVACEFFAQVLSSLPLGQGVIAYHEDRQYLWIVMSRITIHSTSQDMFPLVGSP